MGGILSKDPGRKWLGRADRQAPGPSQTTINSPGAIQVVGDENILQLAPATYWIESFPLEAPAIPEDAIDKPSALLAASYQVVSFSGRSTELGGLREWRNEPRLGQAVRLIYGPAGQGKTRLTAEFAVRSASDGWVVARAQHEGHGKDSAVDGDGSVIRAARGLLVIVDYAERWPRSDLLSLIQGPLLQTAPLLRVLLVARSADWWWGSLQRGLTASGIAVDQMQPLAPLADSEDVRIALFNEARDRFAELLGVSSPAEVRPPESMRTDDVFKTVLTVHMTALAAVHAELRGNTAPSDPGAVSAYLLERERDHWERLQADSPSFTTPPLVMARAVYAAILIGRVRYKSALAALASASIATAPEVANQILADHKLCYPPLGEGLLEPLYPDRLGEDFLGLLTPGHSADYQPDDWADEAVTRLLRHDRDRYATEWARSAVPVLIEAAGRWPHLAERELYPLLSEMPDLAVAAGGQALAGLAALPGIRSAVLAAVERRLPAGRRIDLDVGIAAIASKVADVRLAEVTDQTERAAIHRNLGWRLSNAGLYEDAVEESGQAVRLYEGLGSEAEAEPDLARALDDLGNSLSGLGLRRPALANFDRAAQIYTRLLAAGHGEGEYEPSLAESLTDAARELWYLGQGPDALARALEAVAIYRRLVSRRRSDSAGAAGEPPDHRPQLARALLTLGTIKAELEGPAEGIADLQEAIGILRQLVQHNRYSHELELAKALNNLGVDLALLGEQDAALAANEEAAEIGRRLVKRNPAVIQPLLATWLRNLSRRLSELNRQRDALALLEGAVGVRRLLAQANPALYEADLAWDLDELSELLAGLERHDDAWAAAEESRTIQDEIDARAVAEMATPNLRGVPDTDSEHLARLDKVEGAEEPRGDDSLSIPSDLLLELPAVEPVESAVAQATGDAGVQSVRSAVASGWLYALGYVAGDTSLPGHGTESDLLHFTVEDETGTDVTMLPVFTSASALRSGLLRNPEWQELSALEVDGEALLTNIDDDVAVVINPWTSQEFLLPSRLAGARTDS
jgi:tetratricopeptide (TPR) repeat protein